MNKIFSKTFRRVSRICGLLALFAALIMLGGCGGADAGIEITQQPQDVEVNYPDGATFHVEVAKQ